jgi:hypothetical protein
MAFRNSTTELRRLPAAAMDVTMGRRSIPKLCRNVPAEFLDAQSPAWLANIGLGRPSQNAAGVFM